MGSFSYNLLKLTDHNKVSLNSDTLLLCNLGQVISNLLEPISSCIYKKGGNSSLKSLHSVRN